jgi:hypothetical protein
MQLQRHICFTKEVCDAGQNEDCFDSVYSQHKLRIEDRKGIQEERK